MGNSEHGEVWSDRYPRLVADDQVGIVLIETVTTAHTGAAVIDSTVPIKRQVGSAQGQLDGCA